MAKDPKDPKEPDSAPEEELNIEGPDIPSDAPSVATIEGEPPEADINRMETHVANLTDIVAPGASNEEFITKLLQTPDEQLIPWEECVLPSRGIFYNWPDGTVKVRAMGQIAEKILATQRLAQSGQSIDYLFRECCQFPDAFDPVNLLLGDRIFLLYYLRGITHGNIYEFAITCPDRDCESVTTHKYDLNELAQTIVWAEPGLGDEPFRVDLPYLTEATGRDVWVSVKFLRAGDANDMLAKKKTKDRMMVRPGGVKTRQTRGQMRSADPRRQEAENQRIDDTITDNMEKIVVNVMGVGDVFTVRSFINKLHSQDTATIREWLRNNTPGIDNTVTVTCTDCGNEFTTELPITESFFRPAKK
jgi:hypothetical protein